MAAAGDGSQVSSSEPTSQPAVVTPPPADPDPASTPVISMTAALKDVGVVSTTLKYRRTTSITVVLRVIGLFIIY